MKNAFNSILLLTIVGFVVLVTGAIYFGAPLFGWIILIAIFAVFLAEQIMTLRAVKQVNEENELIASCENRKSFIVNGDGVVARRLKMANRLAEKGIRLDSPIAFEVLSASSNVAVPRSSSGTVILLGLMGTFFGLMFSVATAGSAMDRRCRYRQYDDPGHPRYDPALVPEHEGHFRYEPLRPVCRVDLECEPHALYCCPRCLHGTPR